MSEIKITKENFDSEVKQSKKPVLLDFWAPWCNPCSMLSPVLSQIATEFEGELTVGKVNVDEQGELAADFSVSSIPTVVMIKDGKAVSGFVGYKDISQVRQFIAHVLLTHFGDPKQE